MSKVWKNKNDGYGYIFKCFWFRWILFNFFIEWLSILSNYFCFLFLVLLSFFEFFKCFCNFGGFFIVVKFIVYYFFLEIFYFEVFVNVKIYCDVFVFKICYRLNVNLFFEREFCRGFSDWLIFWFYLINDIERYKIF